MSNGACRLIVWAAGPLIVLASASGGLSAEAGDQVAGELDAQRLIGKGYYENAETPPQFEPAAQAFRRCVELAPTSAIDWLNLGLTLMRAEKYEEALKTLQNARRLDPDLLAAAYATGIVCKRLARVDEAIRLLELVVERDPRCMGAHYNLGVCYKLVNDYDKAVAAFKRAVEIQPTHPSAHLQLMTLYRQLGQVDNVARHKEIFDQVKDTVEESEKTAEALERSKYSYVILPPKLTGDLEPRPDAPVRFVDVSPEVGFSLPPPAPAPPMPPRLKRDGYNEDQVRKLYASHVGGAVALNDFDADGDLDIYVVNCAPTPEASANRLYRNDGTWHFTDATVAFGVGDAGLGTHAVFGDYDNDGHEDLYVVNAGPNVLYRKQGDGVFQVIAPDAGRALALIERELSPSGTLELTADVSSVETPGRQNNALLVFDYQTPDHFKFAGADFTAGQWVMGHFDGQWVNDAQIAEGLVIGQSYTLRLRLAGNVATLLVVQMGEDAAKASYDFGQPVTTGRVGLGARSAVTRFDNVTLRTIADASGASSSALYHEDFRDGTADGLRPVAGDWKVVDWAFENVSEKARVAEPQFGRAAVFFDYDHDNDLDIFIANDVDLRSPPDRDTYSLPADFPGQLNTLLRNNGNGTFSDCTDEANLLTDLAQSVDLLFTDFDDDSDTDLLVVNANAPSLLLLNARLGRFETGGTFKPPLGENGRAAAERDFNRDGTPDLLFAAGNVLYLYLNDGKANFTGKPITLPEALQTGVADIDILDYNNDGWADLLLTSADGSRLRLLASTGPVQFRDVSAAVGLVQSFGDIADVAVGDLDRDGDQDLVLHTRDRGPRLLRNDTAGKAHFIDVRLVGKKVNRDGYGSLVEIAAAGHYQKQTVTGDPVHFGLGDLDHLDIVRVTWPNGQAQNVIRPSIDQTLEIVQHVKVSASCAFLYAYNGRRFELVNEILGIGPLGVPMAPGVYFPLDDTELTRIESHQLAPKDGFYDLRLTEELNEITYADQITLRVVDHPAGLEIIPNEMFAFPPPADRFFAVADRRPPVSATDDRGRDVRELILEHDGRFPPFALVDQYDGLAEPHSITLDLGNLSDAAHVMLFLDGWIYWPDSSVTIAIAQDPHYKVTPLRLEVRDQDGHWQTAIESVGLPTSKGIVVPVDLTGKLLCDDCRVRLSTNMCVYFDRIFVTTSDHADGCRVTELPVAHADLLYRGFSRMTRDRFGYERFDYADVDPVGSWNPPRGLFTRYGDVTPLLARPDNRYVIFGPGDELALRFDARWLPELPVDWTRDFIFFASGWVKDGDLNTKFSETVAPLPFHGMSGYPYGPDEHYPDTPELREYLRAYNTRSPVPTTGWLTTVRSSR